MALIEERHDRVVVDACVLVPVYGRNLFVTAGAEKLIVPRWSQRIHDEWCRAVRRLRPDITAEQLRRVRHLMDNAVPGALVEVVDEGNFIGELPDPDDAHVLAAAVAADAATIVTWNISDFPPSVLAPLNIRAATPDALMCELYMRDRQPVFDVLRRAAANLLASKPSTQEYLEGLRRCGYEAFHEIAMASPVPSVLGD